MATTQYIGARYVPKFFENSATNDSTWAANTAYEPLTIVTWNGNSYTSKKAVPSGVGTPSANAEYWASTGMFNAQVETIREELEIVKDEKIGIPRSKTVLCVGDSYGTISGNWCSYLQTYLGLDNDHFKNLCVSGSGFTVGSTFITQLQNYAGDREAVTDIIVAGGLNDSIYTNSEAQNILIPAIESFITYAKENYPNALIHVCYIGNARDNATDIGTRNVVNRECAKWAYHLGAKDCYMSGVENALSVTLYFMQSDGIHPNADGSRAIARNIGRSMLGANLGEVFPEFGLSPTVTSGYSFTAGPPRTFANEGKYTIKLPEGFTIRANGITIPGNAWTTIATIGGIYFNRPYVFTGKALATYYNEVNNILLDLQIKFEGDTMSIRPRYITGTAWQSLTPNAQTPNEITWFGDDHFWFDPIDIV